MFKYILSQRAQIQVWNHKPCEKSKGVAAMLYMLLLKVKILLTGLNDLTHYSRMRNIAIMSQ